MQVLPQRRDQIHRHRQPLAGLYGHAGGDAVRQGQLGLGGGVRERRACGQGRLQSHVGKRQLDRGSVVQAEVEPAVPQPHQRAKVCAHAGGAAAQLQLPLCRAGHGLQRQRLGLVYRAQDDINAKAQRDLWNRTHGHRRIDGERGQAAALRQEPPRKRLRRARLLPVLPADARAKARVAADANRPPIRQPRPDKHRRQCNQLRLGRIGDAVGAGGGGVVGRAQAGDDQRHAAQHRQAGLKAQARRVVIDGRGVVGTRDQGSRKAGGGWRLLGQRKARRQRLPRYRRQEQRRQQPRGASSLLPLR